MTHLVTSRSSRKRKQPCCDGSK